MYRTLRMKPRQAALDFTRKRRDILRETLITLLPCIILRQGYLLQMHTTPSAPLKMRALAEICTRKENQTTKPWCVEYHITGRYISSSSSSSYAMTTRSPFGASTMRIGVASQFRASFSLTVSPGFEVESAIQSLW